MSQKLDKIEEVITDTGNSIWEQIKNFLNLNISFTESISVSILDIIIIVLAITITSRLSKIILKFLTRNLPPEDKNKFNVVYGYFEWLIYIIIFLFTLNSIGVNVNAVFAASAAFLLGIGLALQTLFKDIITGVLILIDQSVHAGDVIEFDGKVGRIEEIKLRTTRAVTIDNKVMVIPNHVYLENSIYNWTQNNNETRENITVGVAYGSDVQLVKNILLRVATSHPDIVSEPNPVVVFEDFGESSLDFELIFTPVDSFKAKFPKSDLRFEIDRLFRENNVTIPFPQRDVHIKR